MRYLLIQRNGVPGQHTYRGNLFESVSVALAEVRKRFLAGERAEFLIEGERNRIIMNDADIAGYCATLQPV
jgi:hypothetical protein